MIKRLLILLSILFALLGCSRQTAVPRQPVLVLRYADNQDDGYPTTLAARYFASLVDEESHGRIKINVYGNGALGEELEVLDQVRYGGIDFARLSLAVLSKVYPEGEVLQLPYLYRDGEHMWHVLDGDIGDAFLQGVEPHGLIGLCWFDAGARSFYTREPVKNLEDIQGKMIRVQESKQMEELVRTLGANPVQLPFGSVYSALQTSRIFGAENNIPSWYYTSHYRAAPYLFLDEHMRIPELVAASPKAMEQIKEIDPALVDVVKACAKQAARYERYLWLQEEELTRKTVEAGGGMVIKPDEAELKRWKDALQSLYEPLMSTYGPLIEQIKGM